MKLNCCISTQGLKQTREELRPGTRSPAQAEGTQQALVTSLTQVVLLSMGQICTRKNAINQYCKSSSNSGKKNPFAMGSNCSFGGRGEWLGHGCTAGQHLAFAQGRVPAQGHPASGPTGRCCSSTWGHCRKATGCRHSSFCSVSLNISFAHCICCCSF